MDPDATGGSPDGTDSLRYGTWLLPENLIV